LTLVNPELKTNIVYGRKMMKRWHQSRRGKEFEALLIVGDW
jgi:hypothetical protein